MSNPSSRLGNLFGGGGGGGGSLGDMNGDFGGGDQSALKYRAPKEPSKKKSVPKAATKNEDLSPQQQQQQQQQQHQQHQQQQQQQQQHQQQQQQQQQQTPQPQPTQNLVFSSVGFLFKSINNSYQPYPSPNNNKLGCVIIGQAKTYSLLIYDAAKKQIVNLPVTPSFTVAPMAGNYLAFGDGFSLCLNDPNLCEQFLRHIALTKAHAGIYDTNFTCEKPLLCNLSPDDPSTSSCLEIGDTAGIHFNAHSVMNSSVNGNPKDVLAISPYDKSADGGIHKIKIGPEEDEPVGKLSESLIGMKVNQKRIVIVPNHLAITGIGTRAPRPRPDSSWIFCEVQLMKIKKFKPKKEDTVPTPVAPATTATAATKKTKKQKGKMTENDDVRNRMAKLSGAAGGGMMSIMAETVRRASMDDEDSAGGSEEELDEAPALVDEEEEEEVEEEEEEEEETNVLVVVEGESAHDTYDDIQPVRTPPPKAKTASRRRSSASPAASDQQSNGNNSTFDALLLQQQQHAQQSLLQLQSTVLDMNSKIDKILDRSSNSVARASDNDNTSSTDMMAMMQKMMAGNAQTAANGFNHEEIAQSVTNLSNEYKKVVDEKSALKRSFTEIEDKMSTMRDEKNDLLSQKSDLIEKRMAIMDQLHEAQLKIKELESAAVDDKKSDVLAGELTSLKEEFAMATQGAETARKEVEALKKELEESTNSVASLKSDNDQLSVERDVAIAELSKLGGADDDHAEETKVLSEKISEQQNQIDNLTKQLSDASAAQTQIDDLTQQLAETEGAQKKIDTLIKQLAEAEEAKQCQKKKEEEGAEISQVIPNEAEITQRVNEQVRE